MESSRPHGRSAPILQGQKEGTMRFWPTHCASSEKGRVPRWGRARSWRTWNPSRTRDQLMDAFDARRCKMCEGVMESQNHRSLIVPNQTRI